MPFFTMLLLAVALAAAPGRKLVGSAAYTSDTAKNGAMEGVGYIDAPVANLVRSTATSGTIHVTVSAPGLEPATVTIASVPPDDDVPVTGIDEPRLADSGRVPITRASGLRTATPAAGPAAEDTTWSYVTDDRQRIKSALFVPDAIPLEVQHYGQFEPAPGVVAERVSYATDYGLRVPAIVYRPKQVPASRMPGIVVVNGHGGDKYSWYSFYTGIAYAQGGAAVLTYDPIGEGERNAERKDGTRQHDRNVDPPEMARRLGGLMITDVIQAVSYLAQRPDVDSHRIAAVGYSMGSFVLASVCAVDTRINSCVLAGGGNLDGPGGYWDSSSKKMCQAIPYQSLMFLGDRGAAIYSLHAARGATLVINGADDDVVDMPRTGVSFFEDLRRRTVALRGSDKNVFDFTFIPGGGHRPYFVTRPAALWLEERLHFPNWTAASIANMPETHIMEWAAKNHVSVDKLYATELREGGTRAIGADIPAVPHDALNALPFERWQRDKALYVYETWVKNAKARSKLLP